MLTHKREKDLGIEHLVQRYPSSELGVRATDQGMLLNNSRAKSKGSFGSLDSGEEGAMRMVARKSSSHTGSPAVLVLPCVPGSAWRVLSSHEFASAPRCPIQQAAWRHCVSTECAQVCPSLLCILGTAGSSPRNETSLCF